MITMHARPKHADGRTTGTTITVIARRFVLMNASRAKDKRNYCMLVSISCLYMYARKAIELRVLLTGVLYSVFCEINLSCTLRKAVLLNIYPIFVTYEKCHFNNFCFIYLYVISPKWENLRQKSLYCVQSRFTSPV